MCIISTIFSIYFPGNQSDYWIIIKRQAGVLFWSHTKGYPVLLSVLSWLNSEWWCSCRDKKSRRWRLSKETADFYWQHSTKKQVSFWRKRLIFSDSPNYEKTSQLVEQSSTVTKWRCQTAQDNEEAAHMASRLWETARADSVCLSVCLRYGSALLSELFWG